MKKGKKYLVLELVPKHQRVFIMMFHYNLQLWFTIYTVLKL